MLSRVLSAPVLPGLALCLAATRAFGGSIAVPSDAPTIADALLRSAAGDTVLVAPGTYRELVQMKNGVVLRSTEGPENTILQPPNIAADLTLERIVECLEGIDSTTVIEGLTFEGGGVAGTGIHAENASPTIRGNVFRGLGWSMQLRQSASLVEDNVIEEGGGFGILMRASTARIFRNDILNVRGRAITVGGAQSHPVIGGSEKNANRIAETKIAIFMDSRNDVDATWNDWGWETTAEMERKGYPADISTITDGNDRTRTHRGRGTVDYRNWIRPKEETSSAPDTRTITVIGIALALVIAFIALSRRRAASGPG